MNSKMIYEPVASESAFKGSERFLLETRSWNQVIKPND